MMRPTNRSSRHPPAWKIRARQLRAIADFDEALMYLRRGLPSDPGLAAQFLREASAAFDSMGMTGWSERARRIHQSGSEQGL